MKPFTTVGALLFAVVCAGHTARLCLGWEVTINGLPVPFWVSVAGAMVTGVLAVMLWRESQTR